MCCLGDGRIVSGSWDKSMKVWRVDANHQLEEAAAKQDAHGSGVSCLCCLGDGRIVSGSTDKSVKVWSITEDCSLVMDLVFYGDTGISSIVALPDGCIYAGSDTGKTIEALKEE